LRGIFGVARWGRQGWGAEEWMMLIVGIHHEDTKTRSHKENLFGVLVAP